MDLGQRIAAARGDTPVDLLLTNGRLVNVFTGSIEKASIAIAGGYVVGFGAYDAIRTVDLQNQVVAPGFIDAHVHIESSMISVEEFGRSVLPYGTTAVVADPHEITNVLGSAGLDYMLAASASQPVQFFFSLPSCVPATHLERSGAEFTTGDIQTYVSHPRVVALAEMMNYPGVIAGYPEVMEKLKLARQAGKPMDGHAPGVSGRSLHAYLLPGISSDHECTSGADAMEKLAAGMHIMVREGSAARNLMDLLPIINNRTSHRMMWCTDDRNPVDLLSQGHIDSIVRKAVQEGLSPVIAIQMATLNPANYFGLTELGAIAPGKRADLVVFNNLKTLQVTQVYTKGLLAAENGTLVTEMQSTATPPAPNSMHVAPGTIDFRVTARGPRIRVMEIIPGQIITRSLVRNATIDGGEAIADPKNDLVKIAVVERHHCSGQIGLGFINGLGIRQGAIASTVAHDSHNIVVAGVNDTDMHLAVKILCEIGGGQVAIADGQILAQVPLPIAGLMSDLPIVEVRDQLVQLHRAVNQMGSALPDPFMALSFMALPVIPELKITDKGLVDVTRFEIVPLFVD